jgi:hypothetical protein
MARSTGEALSSLARFPLIAPKQQKNSLVQREQVIAIIDEGDWTGLIVREYGCSERPAKSGTGIKVETIVPKI